MTHADESADRGSVGTLSSAAARRSAGANGPAPRAAHRKPTWAGPALLVVGRWSLTLVGLLLLTGCPGGLGNSKVKPEPVGDPPIDEREALSRVNENLSRLEEPLVCAARVSFSFRDNAGERHSFLQNDARLFFAQPRSLIIDVRSLAGSIAQFGSTAERYWVWIDPELRKLWWGTWARVGEISDKRLPLPPDLLLDALMLRPLPRNSPNEVGPILQNDGGIAKLIYTRKPSPSRPPIMREIVLDAAPPYQPVEIRDRRADGGVVMIARLSKYDRVAQTGPFIPRRYRVEWPANDAKLELDIVNARFQSDLSPEIFTFPPRWRGAIEALDPPGSAAAEPEDDADEGAWRAEREARTGRRTTPRRPADAPPDEAPLDEPNALRADDAAPEADETEPAISRRPPPADEDAPRRSFADGRPLPPLREAYQGAPRGNDSSPEQDPNSSAARARLSRAARGAQARAERDEGAGAERETVRERAAPDGEISRANRSTARAGEPAAPASAARGRRNSEPLAEPDERNVPADDAAERRPPANRQTARWARPEDEVRENQGLAAADPVSLPPLPDPPLNLPRVRRTERGLAPRRDSARGGAIRPQPGPVAEAPRQAELDEGRASGAALGPSMGADASSEARPDLSPAARAEIANPAVEEQPAARSSRELAPPPDPPASVQPVSAEALAPVQAQTPNQTPTPGQTPPQPRAQSAAKPPQPTGPAPRAAQQERRAPGPLDVFRERVDPPPTRPRPRPPQPEQRPAPEPPPGGDARST